MHGDAPAIPFGVNDVVAVTAFIGSIFGAGGGAEHINAEFLATLKQGMGEDQGQAAWEDAMLFNDPEAPTTIDERFDYGPLTGGNITGSAVIDPGSFLRSSTRPPRPRAPVDDDAAITVPADAAPITPGAHRIS